MHAVCMRFCIRTTDFLCLPGLLSELHGNAGRGGMCVCASSADLAAQCLGCCAGTRLVHRNHRGGKGLQAYREQLTKLLREGAAGGRIIKGRLQSDGP